MTTPDARKLADALTDATADQWTAERYMHPSRIYAVSRYYYDHPPHRVHRVHRVWVDCFTQPGGSHPGMTVRRVVVRARGVSGSLYIDIAPGRGWPERAAAVVVEVLPGLGVRS